MTGSTDAEIFEKLVDELTRAQRKRDEERWCFQSAAAVFSSKPYARNKDDLLACADRLEAAQAHVDSFQDLIDEHHKREREGKKK